MDFHAQPGSWSHTWMTYSLLSSNYPALVRYISGAFIALGLFFVVPIVLLIAFDFSIWAYRICWSRPGSPPQELMPRQLNRPPNGPNALQEVGGVKPSRKRI
ncbi:uncharacterized protein CTRU02_211026 [Colletotrichum truncatum]|uniref:Uncharacterized protein n=1 Tax=Colletotrichum truncatum TaxID=5467 RepID=A0ACC3YQU5_COLTU|nr:uncharacterized protein CTRU02_01807 [Colletotrichum truncatum]KAF6798936.1 hypothetical protein CTRU02_01807 [Colletotrichum truncatum]